MPPDVVTMNSRVRFVVEPAGREAAAESLQTLSAA
jgi:hypothetical protein